MIDRDLTAEELAVRALRISMRAAYGVWYENGILVGGVIPFPVTPRTPGISYWSVKTA